MIASRTRRLLGLAALVVAAFLLLIYLGDTVSLALRFPNHREQFGSVHVRRLLAVPQKNGKTEFLNDDPVDVPCVHSLFPHFGDAPCWYAQKHTQQRVDL